MIEPSYILLYVQSPAASAEFYTRLLDKAPVENSPTFALFILSSGVKLGLWTRSTVIPTAPASGSGCELACTLESHAAVDALHAQWKASCIEIAQPPVALDFGYAFTALDLDGHRLRVFCPAAM